MEKSEKKDSKRSVDARVINLYQGNVNGSRLFADEAQYNVFAHYEVIEVYQANQLNVDYTDKSPLLRAYATSSSERHRSSQQTLLAFADVIEEITEGEVGYSQEQIDEFWNNNTEPILFLSMISLGESHKYTSVLKKIDEIYADVQHLAYITFDYCNILIFSRDRSFQRSVKNILTLDFASGCQIVDSITLYSFAKEFSKFLDPVEPEIFGAYLRFGVKDLDAMENFYSKLEADTTGVIPEKNWIIGRHDVGILCRNANLNWLATALKAMENAQWYSSFTLSVMINSGNISVKGRLPDAVTTSSLSNEMNKRFQEFQQAYRERCQAVGVYEDIVWMRWLKETSELAVDLLENKMTCDLGVSLVPQFLDFLEYAKKLWSDGRLVQGKKWKEAQECFAVLLSNISILIDSMNHHSRQFITSPPFHTVAFSMPPKLMAYYTMVLHQMISILQDQEREKQYWITLTPQFAQTLNVRTLTEKCHELLDGSQYFSIGISEGSMFRLQHTTAVLAHEISHFVGWKGRSRCNRKQAILYTELYNIVLDITQHFSNALKGYYMISAKTTDFNEDVLPPLVERLQNKLINLDPEYEKSKNCFLSELKAYLQHLPFHLFNSRPLCDELFECSWELLIERNGCILQLGKCIQEKECHRTGIPIALGKDALTLSKQNLYRIFRNLLQSYCESYNVVQDEQEQRWENLCNAFSEVYADLQTILLLELDFGSYIRLFTIRHSEKIPQIEQSRILALMATLKGCKGWKETDFAKIKEMHNLIHEYDSHNVQSLVEKNIDFVAVEQLQNYLTRCTEVLNSKLSAKDDGLHNLRALYSSLSNEHPVAELVDTLSEEIWKYRQYLLAL